jgi:hypothetical protein
VDGAFIKDKNGQKGREEVVDTEIKSKNQGKNWGLLIRERTMRGGKINGLGARGQNRHRLGLTLNARGEFAFSFYLHGIRYDL